MMDRKQSKSSGLWIIPEILHNPELSIQEKILLAQVVNLDEHLSCFATNSFFANILNVTKNRVSRIIGKLVDNDFLTSIIDNDKGNRRILIPNYKRIEETQIAISENNNTPSSNTSIGVVENTNNNKELYKNYKKLKHYENSKNIKQNKNRYEFNTKLDYTQGL